VLDVVGCEVFGPGGELVNVGHRQGQMVQAGRRSSKVPLVVPS
jgi:hypothetical protein